MEVERQENEKNRIEQEKLNEIERRKKEAEWIEQEKINEIERRKKEKNKELTRQMKPLRIG